MSQGFRCYFVDSSDHYVAREDVDSATLADAIQMSLALLAKRPNLPACGGFELWDGDKLVHKHTTMNWGYLA
jgi:hypothetical protein